MKLEPGKPQSTISEVHNVLPGVVGYGLTEATVRIFSPQSPGIVVSLIACGLMPKLFKNGTPE